MNYIPTIGLEVHVQLKTRSKMFCGCAVEFGAEPNSRTCPTCLGLPGALPVMNAEALRMTALAGLMLGCRIDPVCKFDRKNYYYPDMPKNYQISQFDLPFCLAGRVPLTASSYPADVVKAGENETREVALTRIHLEEDVAKSFHFEERTGIDFNRAGTPLLEIVSEPDMTTPEEAFAYLTALKQILIAGGVSDADMEKGQLRCDCNVSVRPDTADELGVKIELKNRNSISGVRRAVAYEIERQTEAVRRGETLHQETRRWDDDAGQTFAMRTKESSHDYRYFPDPDLVPVRTEAIVEEMRGRVPELPEARRARFVAEYGVSDYDAGILVSDGALADYFEAAARTAKAPKAVANWVLNDLLSALSVSGQAIGESPVEPSALLELLELIDAGQISGKQAREVFAAMFESRRGAAEIVEEKGMKQESDAGAIEALCRQVIEAHPGVVAEYRAGKTVSINFLKGQCMKLSGGTANPAVVGEVLAELLNGKTS